MHASLDESITWLRNLMSDVAPGPVPPRSVPPSGPELLALVYEELRGIARRVVRGEHDERSLGATGLVHEAVLRLLSHHGLSAGAEPDRVLAIATRTMSCILVDRARARRRQRRGGGWTRVALDDVLDAFEARRLDFEALHEAIERLEVRNPRLARLVTLRYLVGLSNQEMADALGSSLSTVETGLRAARAWLRRELAEPFEPGRDIDGPDAAGSAPLEP